MPSSYTTSLRLTLPATGELSGTWGTTVNTGITELTDAAIAGYVSIAMTDADYTLTVANGATDQARRMMLNMTGTLSAARNVICPTASKLYIIKNATTGGYAITLKTSAGTGISIPNGKSMLLMCDGTNVVDAVTNFSSLTLGSPLLPASGGTGLTALGTGVATFLGTPSSANLAAAVTDETGSGSLVFGTSPTLSSPTITGTGTAAFGNLSYTGTLTGGTGVVNLGSGQFYKDASGNVGIGTASPGAKLEVRRTYGKANGIAQWIEAGDGAGTVSDNVALLLNDGSGGAQGGNAIIFRQSNAPSPRRFAGLWGLTNASGAGGNLVFATINSDNDTTGPTERMRLDSSGNLGIGTSSPGSYGKFAVQNGVIAAVSADGTVQSVHSAANTGQVKLSSYNASGTSYLTFGTGVDVERMRLDSSGNLGLGVTPSAWGGSGRAFDITSTGSFEAIGANSTSFSYNRYFNGTSNIYKTTGFATIYSQNNSGQHTWFTAPSGTAGNAITFTQAMTLDASGRLGIGTASPTARLQVAGGQVLLDNGQYYGIKDSGGTANSVLYFDASNNLLLGSGGSTITAQFWTGGAERARITSGGDLLVGTTLNSYSDKAVIAGNLTLLGNQLNVTAGTSGVTPFEFVNRVGGGFYWYTNNAANLAMTLDASGNLGVGTNSPSTYGKFVVAGTGVVQSWVLSDSPSNTSFRGFAIGRVGSAQQFGGVNMQLDSGELRVEAGYATYGGFTTFYTNGSERARITSGGDLLVGTTSSLGRLTVVRATGIASGAAQWIDATDNTGFPNQNVALLLNDATGGSQGGNAIIFRQTNGGGTPRRFAGMWGYTNASGSGGNLVFATINSDNDTTGPTERARITSGGDVGINTTSPDAKLDVVSTGLVGVFGSESVSNAYIGFKYNSTILGYVGNGSGVAGPGSATDFSIGSTGARALTFGTNDLERARITSGGDLCVGATAAINIYAGSTDGAVVDPAGVFVASRSGDVCAAFRRRTSDGSIVLFNRDTTNVGSISVTTTATSYVTSSDYRLKDNPQPLTNSGAFIDALQPKTWDWKADGSRGVGFLAHEVQAVSPRSVVGEKDAVDEDGKPVMQAMEYGSAEFIANIIAELQSLRARVAALEAN